MQRSPFATMVSRRNVLELSALATLAPLFQTPQQRSQDVQTLNAQNGDLAVAWYKTNGTTALVLVRRQTTPDNYQGQLVFNENASGLLTVTANMARKQVAGKLGSITIVATAPGVNIYSLTVNAADISVESRDDRQRPKGIATVQIKVGEIAFENKFDFETWKFLSPSKAPHLTDAIPDRVQKLIEPFTASLEQEAKRLSGKQPEGRIASDPSQRPADALWRGRLCRMACWGTIAGAAAICCAGATPIGCAMCSLVGNSAASLCGDMCPA